MIKAVIFDFGNVICSFDLRVLVDRLLPHTTRPRHEIMNAFTGENLVPLYETGDVSTGEFLSTVIKRGQLSLSPEELTSIYTGFFHPIPTTINLIRQLRPAYKLGLLSNTNELHFEHVIRRTEVFGFFDAVTLSFRVRAMKPARAMYDDALARLNCAAGECVFIDDLKENIEAANTLGFHGIRYTTHSDLMIALREFLPATQ
jgi:HAD superfamily hydrolase (TIGR01509 family)